MAVATNQPCFPTTIDMSSLTHAELLSLSLLSNTNHSSNDVVFTVNDHRHSPSSFNESASSHQQTFSDNRHRHRNRNRHQNFHLFKRERSEFNSIINSFKKSLKIKSEENSTKKKRKVEKIGVEIVNKNGVVVDLAALSVLERESDGGPYGEELRRRAEGRDKEEELLIMLGEMRGEWCSRRKKRRIVEGCLLSDVLPVGWKIIIALRRKGGRFFPYCRRYVSPTGEQYASCKEVLSYLQSYFGISDISLLRDARGELCTNSLENSLVDVSISPAPESCAPVEHGNDVSALVIDNLSEVPVLDLYECHICSLSFHEKDLYLQHLLSVHQRTTRRFQLGSSVADIVTIKEGKYRPQLCSEVSEERGHLLGHGRDHDSIRPSEDLSVQVTESAKMDGLPYTTGVSPTETLIEGAESSLEEMSPSAPQKEPLSVSNGNKPSEIFGVGVTGIDSISCPSELEMENVNGEVETSFGNLISFNKVSGILNACRNRTEVTKADIEDKASSSKSIPACDEMSDISETDRAIYDSGVYSVNFEKGINQDESSTKEQSPCVEVTAISVTDRIEVESTVDELELEKNSGQMNLFCAELNPSDDADDIVMTDDVETKKQACTFSRVVTENYFDIDQTTLPAATGGLNVVNVSECEASAAKKEVSTRELKLDSEQASENDDMELANLSSGGRTEPHKAGQHMAADGDQNLGTEYMELDVTEPHTYNTMNELAAIPLSEISMDMGKSTETGLEFHSSIVSLSEFHLGVSGEGLKTTFCVWCGIDFFYELVDIELQPDSVGFMCPTCRNKISKQLNELESSFSLDSHHC